MTENQEHFRERRRYFRIDDLIGIHYSLATDDQWLREQIQHQGRQQQQIDQLDSEISTLLTTLRRENPLTAEVLGLLHRKVQHLAGQIPQPPPEHSALRFEILTANVSACGIAFPSPQAHEAGSLLQLNLQLHPDNRQIRTLARVVNCLPTDNAPASWRLQLSYEQISRSDQEALVRFVLAAQSRQLRRTQH